MSTITPYYSGKYKKQDGTITIYLRLYIKRKRVLISTGISVEEKYWDKQKFKVKPSHKNSKDYNLVIDNLKARANLIFVRYRLLNEDLTPEIFRKEIKNPSTYIDFYEFWESQMTARDKLISPNTVKSHKSVLEKLKEFKSSLKFSEIDEQFIYDFKRYLKVRKNNNNNTIQKNLGTLKAYLNIAVKKDLIRKNPFATVPIKKFKSNIEYLTRDEIQLMVDAYFSDKLPVNYSHVLQYFLFSIFVGGLRISDVKRIKIDDIIGNILTVNVYKLRDVNAEVVKIPLTELAKKLISRELKTKESGLLFRCYSDQVTNRLLKKVAIKLEIEKDINFKMARHTFATLFLEETDDIATLQKLMGHSRITQTMVYAHVTPIKKEKQMEKFSKRFKL